MWAATAARSRRSWSVSSNRFLVSASGCGSEWNTTSPSSLMMANWKTGGDHRVHHRHHRDRQRRYGQLSPAGGHRQDRFWLGRRPRPDRLQPVVSAGALPRSVWLVVGRRQLPKPAGLTAVKDLRVATLMGAGCQTLADHLTCCLPSALIIAIVLNWGTAGESAGLCTSIPCHL